MADVCPCCKRPLDAPLNNGLVVSLECNTAARNGTIVHLPTRAIEIVHALNKQWPGTLRYERLLHYVYGGSEPKAEDPLDCIKVKISTMRKPLKAIGVAIKNDYGVGYRLELL